MVARPVFPRAKDLFASILLSLPRISVFFSRVCMPRERCMQIKVGRHDKFREILYTELCQTHTYMRL